MPEAKRAMGMSQEAERLSDRTPTAVDPPDPASGPPSSRTQKRAESRRRILDSAREVFFRDGFMAANLDEVAEKAGVAKGTLYRYFDNKADLYVGVLADNGAAFTERMRVTAAGEGSALDASRIYPSNDGTDRVIDRSRYPMVNFIHGGLGCRET